MLQQRTDIHVRPFLQQSEINSMYIYIKKKVSQQLDTAQSREADRYTSLLVKHKTNPGWNLLRGQRYKHPTTSLRFGWVLSLLHLVCFDNQIHL